MEVNFDHPSAAHKYGLNGGALVFLVLRVLVVIAKLELGAYEWSRIMDKVVYEVGHPNSSCTFGRIEQALER